MRLRLPECLATGLAAFARRADHDQGEAAVGQARAEDLGKPRVEVVRADGAHELHAEGPGDPLDVERRRRPAQGIARLRRGWAGSPR